MRRAYLDTCCVIYLLEEVQGFSVTLRAHMAENPEVILCVSPLVRLEVLIKPLVEGNLALVRDYEDFLSAQQWLPMGDIEFDRATQLRAVHKLKTPDALHLATALRHNCAEFWTNDERLNTAAGGRAVNIFASLRRGSQ
jgi:predicted nucleic acid-binding protein